MKAPGRTPGVFGIVSQPQKGAKRPMMDSFWLIAVPKHYWLNCNLFRVESYVYTKKQ
jgi:hypothetical protein